MQKKSRSFIIICATFLSFTFMNCVGEDLPERDPSQATSNIYDTQELDNEAIYQIIDELLAQDDTTFNALTDEQKAIVIKEIKDNRIYPADSEGVLKASLPYCSGGYWGANWQYESIEARYSTSGLKYQVGSNCYMWAPGDDCGTDYDDYMLSFYFGNHAESLSQLRPMLK